MTHLIGDNSSCIRGDWFTLFGSVGVQCSEAPGDAIIVTIQEPQQPMRGWEWRCMTIRDRDMTFVTLVRWVSSPVCRYQAPGEYCKNATELFRLRLVSQSRQWPWWLCQWWSYWPPSRPHPSENFLKRPSLWMRISFFCSSITRTQTQQLPAPGRVDTKL